MLETMTSVLSATQDDCVERFTERIKKFKVILNVFDPEGQCVYCFPQQDMGCDSQQLSQYTKTIYQEKPGQVSRFGDNNEILGIPLIAADKVVAVALLDTGGLIFDNNEDLRRLSDQYKIDYEILAKTITSNYNPSEYFAEMLTYFAQDFKSSSKTTQQLEIVSSELGQTYEEVMLLYNMSTNMKVTQSEATYLQMACDQITKSVDVEGIAIFLEKTVDGEKRFILTSGSGHIIVDQSIVDVLENYLMTELKNGKEALLDSQIDSEFKYNWPERVKSIIAVPLLGNEKLLGIMVATNIFDKSDFDNIDVKLFNSVAAQCAVFIENKRLFGDIKELFVGSLKALTNSIDAKDQYTRGHSERVAFFARWIAERLAEHQPITEEQIHEIYLAGLLHDIGKIGIDERVLRKRGDLTEEDRNQIKAHPLTGAAILSEIKQMAGIVPGILYHHERVDGQGYPKGLKGNEIPLIGKILCLADTFDAMTSKRIYREAMSIKRAVDEIKKNAGKQFDEQIATVFLESDLQKLWSIIQDGFIESWDYSNFSEYGMIAVGTLIK